MQTMTTWKQPRIKAAKRQKIFMIELAVLTCLCGIVVGYWWSYKPSKVHQLTYELEKTKLDLAKAQIAKISDMHNNIEAALLRFFEAYRKHSQIVEAADKNVSKDKREKTKQELEIMWESEFSPLKEHLAQLENTLSELENREPRDFDLPAPPPMMLKESRRYSK